MVAQEKIKKVDAAFTWPHPTDKGYFVSACFVRTDNNDAYLVYCPKATCAISIDEETSMDYNFWFSEAKSGEFRKIALNQILSKDEKIVFYVIYLGMPKLTNVSKKDIEKLFHVKVVD